ncbi:hypothetical protein [uncultured Piscinibacter sp.]|uniref:hypothetical protein n=1 Tax=uncultured Piscinibacter sp. TaxID=1131835 RepID=UPI00262FA937|nr:hypothetical protein [uncultured Piscinibacter sp.]
MGPKKAGVRWRCTALAVAIAASGCATEPLVPAWQAPDAIKAGDSMPGALGYLDSLRTRYRNAVATQLNDERNASNALLGTGALIAALALGNVHRDAIVGTAFLGGTGYAFSQSNLQRPRLLVYQAGVEALNCAERAVTPFSISVDDRTRLATAIGRLEGERKTLAAGIATAQGVAAANPGDVGLPDLQQALTAARVQLEDSEKTLRSASAFSVAATRGARDLVAAVNSIDAAVVRSLVNATPDLSNVPKLVSGLAGMVSAIAPGAGVDDLLNSRLAAVKSGMAMTETGKKSDVQKATETLINTVAATQAANADTAALLAGRTGPFPDDAFKDCGVAQVVTALAVSPQRLSFTADQEDKRIVDISGGIKPYFVEVEGPVSKALTAKGPVRFDTRSDLTFASNVLKGATEGTLRVSDSAPNAPNIVTIPVSVAAAAPSNGAGNGEDKTKDAAGNKPSTSPAKATVPAPAPSPDAAIDTAITALKTKAQFKFGGKAYVRSDNPIKDGRSIRFTVTCPDGAAPVKRVDLASAYLAEAGVKGLKPDQLAITTLPADCATP